MSDEAAEPTELATESIEEPIEPAAEVRELKPERPLEMALPAAAVAVDARPDAPEVTSLRMDDPREAIWEVRS